MEIEDIARICHQANRALCVAAGEPEPSDWDYVTEAQRESARAGVIFRMTHPNASPEAQHLQWMAHKAAAGWVYGSFKDETAKRHPCMVPFGELPPMQQAKDHLFAAICAAMVPFLGTMHRGPAPVEPPQEVE